jgi:hypothetical protein
LRAGGGVLALASRMIHLCRPEPSSLANNVIFVTLQSLEAPRYFKHPEARDSAIIW